VRAEGRSVNIRDVAREADVGVGTVSRVLNGSDEISPATREHVLAVMRRLRYRPNAQARRIMGRAEMVCFVLANRPFLHSFHASILQGVEACARDMKQHVVFLAMHYDTDTPPVDIQLPPLLEEKGWVDGIIMTGALYPNLIRRIETLDLPLVVFGNNVIDLGNTRAFGQVRYDGTRAQFEATQYLVDLGHRRIAFVGDTQYPWFRDQHQGYLRAMRANELDPLSLTENTPEAPVEYGERSAASLLKRKSVPTAILAGNDEVAYGLSRSLRRLGVKIPEDISLVGFDDSELAALMDPPLTTVRVYTQGIGQACMKLLS
jgi:LacI family transcriptional regulator